MYFYGGEFLSVQSIGEETDADTSSPLAFSWHCDAGPVSQSHDFSPHNQPTNQLEQFALEKTNRQTDGIIVCFLFFFVFWGACVRVWVFSTCFRNGGFFYIEFE